MKNCANFADIDLTYTSDRQMFNGRWPFPGRFIMSGHEIESEAGFCIMWGHCFWARSQRGTRQTPSPTQFQFSPRSAAKVCEKILFRYLLKSINDEVLTKQYWCIRFTCFIRHRWTIVHFIFNNRTIQYNTTLLPSVNTIARRMFSGAKYTHHTFTPVIKH